METRKRLQWLALVAGTALLAAGCGERGSESVGERMDRSADRIAESAGRAADRAVTAIDDAAITARVKAAVMAEPGLRPLGIGVETRDGVVTLAGTVNGPDQRQRALQIAQGVAGVRAIDDQLVVKPV